MLVNHMQWYKVTITPKSDFGSSLKGDMLFGQFCWGIYEKYGKDKLSECLVGYTQGNPFVIFSDAFPDGYIPRPSLPVNYWDKVPVENRKNEKSKKWIPEASISQQAINQISAEKIDVLSRWHVTHNTINRSLSRVSGDGFAPFQIEQSFFNKEEMRICIYMLLDSELITLEECRDVLDIIGKVGFGRDASTGMGKFNILDIEEYRIHPHREPNAYLTLAPCAVQGYDWQEDCCFYRPFIRFGKHGGVAAKQRNIFKKPVIMADTGAILTLSAANNKDYDYLGQGVGGADNPISSIIKETVHQGYSPVVAVRVEEKQ